MEKLSRLTIGGKSYPVKVDLNVLEVIQNEFGTINNFERDLLGIKIQTDDEGNIVYNSEGDPEMYLVEPSIKAITTILPLMVNEGLEIEALQKGKAFEPVDAKLLIGSCDTAFSLLSKQIHAEYKKCFATKK